MTSLAAAFLTVACPTCKAKVGEPCDYRGARGRLTHLRRQDRAVRALNREAS